MRLCGQGYLEGSIEEDEKWRLNWERMRIRTLLTKKEFDVVDRALKVEDTEEEHRLLWENELSQPHIFHQFRVSPRPKGESAPYAYEMSKEPSFHQTVVILNMLMKSIYCHLNEPYAFKERFYPELVAIASALSETHDQVHLAMLTPLPLPYVNLVRTLLLGFLFTQPLFMHHHEGFFANVIMPSISAMALIGIDHIGFELENPFGDDANDLDVQEMINKFERELMRMLELAGDAGAREQFVFLPVPKFMQEETTCPFQWYVALKSQVDHLDIPMHRAERGLRVRHVNVRGAGRR